MDGAYTRPGLPAAARENTIPRALAMKAALARVVALCAAFGLAACAASPGVHTPSTAREDAPAALTIDRPEQAFDLAGVTELVVDNPLGDIHVRSASENEARANLFVQRWAGDGSGARVRPSPNRGRLFLVVEPRHRSASGSASQGGASRPLRADLVLLVPPRISLRLYTGAGDIELRKLANPVIGARSDSGDIEVIASSRIDAQTASGEIRATLVAPGWTGEQRLVTGSGDILAYVPLGPDLSVDARSGGAIAGRWSALVTAREDAQELFVRHGSGADRLMLRSGSGRIEVHELVAGTLRSAER